MGDTAKNIGTVLWEDQRAEIVSVLTDLIPPAVLKRLYAKQKSMVWIASVTSPILIEWLAKRVLRLPIASGTIVAFLSKFTTEFNDELKRRAKATEGDKTKVDDPANKMSIADGAATLKKAGQAAAFTARTNALEAKKKEVLLALKFSAQSAKGWATILATVPESEFKGVVDFLLTVTPPKASEEKKIQVMVELANIAIYPNLNVNLLQIDSGLRKLLIEHIEALPADKAIDYLGNLEAMDLPKLREHAEAVRENHESGLTTAVREALGGKGIVETVVDLRKKAVSAGSGISLGGLGKTFLGGFRAGRK